MNQFEIPKEIKTKPKLLGLEIKEMAILVLLIILIMTFFKDMVHGLFVIPYFIVAVGFLFYMIASSNANPQKKNFHALYLYFKRDKTNYYAMSTQDANNQQVVTQVHAHNEQLFGKERIFEGYQNVKSPVVTTETPVTKVSQISIWMKIRTRMTHHVQLTLLRIKQARTQRKIRKKDAGDGFMLKFFTHTRVNKHLVPALRHFALQDYDAAIQKFEQITFAKLAKTDQDMMLLAYLFTGKAATAIELASDFAETVVNYYKSTNNVAALRQLATKVQSRILDYEVAVDNQDYWKVIELKEFVLMKPERHQNIVEAYIALDNLHKARQYADEVGDTTLIAYVKATSAGSVQTLPKAPMEAPKMLRSTLFTRNEQGDYSFN